VGIVTLTLLVVFVNYFVRISALARAHHAASLKGVWLSLLLATVIEHFLFIAAVIGCLRAISSFRVLHMPQTAKHIRILVTAITFPELFKISAILDCEPAMLVLIGALVISIQRRALQGAVLRQRASLTHFVVLAIAVLFRVLVRMLIFDFNLSVWWVLI
jgi:hypothetical protein